MIRAERLKKIKGLAKEQNIVTWEELQNCLGVSKATAQRDIEILCEGNIVEKTRGGVIFVQEPDERELSIAARNSINKEAKHRIAAAALNFVRRDAFIMLDSGSTIEELTRMLPPDIPLTAVTYSFPTASILDTKPNIETYFAGGKLRKKFMACHGYFAENMIGQFHADICFLGADAVNITSGIGGHNMYDVRLKQIMIENSAKTVLLADRSKLSNNAQIYVAPLDKIDVFITDAGPDDDILAEMRNRGVEVISVAGEL